MKDEKIALVFLALLLLSRPKVVHVLPRKPPKVKPLEAPKPEPKVVKVVERVIVKPVTMPKPVTPTVAPPKAKPIIPEPVVMPMPKYEEILKWRDEQLKKVWEMHERRMPRQIAKMVEAKLEESRKWRTKLLKDIMESSRKRLEEHAKKMREMEERMRAQLRKMVEESKRWLTQFKAKYKVEPLTKAKRAELARKAPTLVRPVRAEYRPPRNVEKVKFMMRGKQVWFVL